MNTTDAEKCNQIRNLWAKGNVAPKIGSITLLRNSKNQPYKKDQKYVILIET